MRDAVSSLESLDPDLSHTTGTHISDRKGRLSGSISGGLHDSATLMMCGAVAAFVLGCPVETSAHNQAR